MFSSSFCSGLIHFGVWTNYLCSPSAELSALNTSKACGPDGICPQLLKEGAEHLAVPLAAL